MGRTVRRKRGRGGRSLEEHYEAQEALAIRRRYDPVLGIPVSAYLTRHARI